MKSRITVVTSRQDHGRTSIRKSGEEFEKESRWSFFIELLLFGLLVVISAWPIVNTVEALRSL